MTTTTSNGQATTLPASAAERKPHVCPWWIGYLLVSPVRRLFESPERLLEEIRPGARVLDFGCAMGYFSIPAARLAGSSGRVVCVDIQERMLKGLWRRARRAGVSERIETVLAGENGDWLGDRAGSFDLVLLFYVVHELPDPPATFAQILRALKPGGRVLLAEPKGHVSSALFEQELEQARAAGLRCAAGLRMRRARTALLQKI